MFTCLYVCSLVVCNLSKALIPFDLTYRVWLSQGDCHDTILIFVNKSKALRDKFWSKGSYQLIITKGCYRVIQSLAWRTKRCQILQKSTQRVAVRRFSKFQFIWTRRSRDRTIEFIGNWDWVIFVVDFRRELNFWNTSKHHPRDYNHVSWICGILNVI